jgi:hypothetical protein
MYSLNCIENFIAARESGRIRRMFFLTYLLLYYMFKLYVESIEWA